jgi:hypothetical protein
MACFRRQTRWTAWFVAAVWALMAASTLAYVYRHGLTSPWADEMRWLPILIGAEPLTAQWVFAPENQHAQPLVKLLYIGLGRAMGFDFHAAALLNTAALAAMALAMVLVVARIRRRASPLDIIIPVVLLNWGHYMSLIWGLMLCYVLPTVLACILLLVVSLNRVQISVARATLTTVCTMAAALCGGPGIFYLLPMAAWLAYAGIRRWRDNRLAAVTILVLAVLSLLPLWLWVPSLLEVKDAATTSGHGLSFALLRSLQFLSMSLGKFGGETFPFSGLAVMVLVALAGWALCRTWQREPQQRLRAAGLGLFLFSALAMALGIGLARTDCLQTRYILLGSPLILCMYLIGAFYGPGIRLRGGRWACAAALLCLAVMYDVKGLHLTYDMEGNVQRLEDSVREGLPIAAIAARHHDDMQVFREEVLARDLEMMRVARVGPYRRTQPIAGLRDVLVAPMLPLAETGDPSEIEVLSGEEQLVQPFIAVLALPLYRIDIEAHPWRRTALRLQWVIDELDAQGRRRTRARGTYAFDQRADQCYARLDFEPFMAAADSRLELRFCLDGDTKARLRVPHYPLRSDYRPQAGRPGTGIRGFLFYDREAIRREQQLTRPMANCNVRTNCENIAGARNLCCARFTGECSLL